ncbi:MAG: RsiV family protein [Pseudomonadota bacterium]
MKARLAGVAICILALQACDRTTPAGESAAPSMASGSVDACPQTSVLCRDPRLAALREQMKSALGKAAADVSAEGARLLAQNQNEWLEAQRVTCGVPAGAATLTPDQQACVQSAIAERVKTAAQAVEKIGPFTFQRVEQNSAEKASAEAAAGAPGAPDTITQEIAFPRIDGDSPAIRKFNEMVAQHPRFSKSDATNETTKYDIAFAGPELISVRFGYYDFSLGAAHPNTDAKAINFNMKTLAPLRASDVFKPGSGWEKALAKKGADGVTKILKGFDDSLPATAPGDLLAAVSDPGKWAITDKALILLFSEEDMGSHAVGGKEVAVPWSDLKQYLNPAAPAPIKAS